MKMTGVEGNWEDFTERLQWRFSKLTQDDMKLIEGREEDTLNRIQIRIGKSRAELLSLFERMKLTV